MKETKMKHSKVYKGLLCSLSLAVAATMAVAQDIKIGFNTDLSASPSAIVGQAGLAAVQAAVEDVNAAGGVLGRKLVVVVRDDTGQPPKAIQNMVELVDNEKVIAVFGASNSGNVMAWKGIANQKKVIGMIPLATGTDITKPTAPDAPNYMFRISLVDRDNVSGVLAYISKNPASKKVGVLTETTGYGQGALKDIQELSVKYGIKPVAWEKFGVADTDMTSQLNKLKAAGVDTVVIWAQATPLAQTLRSMEKISWYPLTLTNWVADQKQVADAAGQANIERPILMRTRVGGEMTPDMAKLFNRIKGKTSLGEPPISQASHSYDALMLLVAAIKQANSTDGEKIKDALENLQTPYKGLMKTYNKPFSKTMREGLALSDYKWVHWKNGRVEIYSDNVTKSLQPGDFKD
jgi:branched-chain amino acid transport system substrate-binding protein